MEAFPFFVREGEWMLFWTALIAIATALYALAVIFTLFYIIGQFNELRKTRTLQAFLALFETFLYRGLYRGSTSIIATSIIATSIIA